MEPRTDILEVVVVVFAVNTSDTEHLDQELVNLVDPYHTDHKRPVSASCDGDDACFVVPCVQSVNNIVVGIDVMVEESPSVALDVAVAASGRIVDVEGCPVDRYHNCAAACTEPVVVGVAAVEEGVADVAWHVKQHAAFGAAGTWEIVG